MTLDHPRVAAGLCDFRGLRSCADRDTGLNNALKLTDAEIAALSPLRLPVVHKRLDIAYGTANCRRWSSIQSGFHDARVSAGAPGMLHPIDGANHFSILGELRRPDGQLVDICQKAGRVTSARFADDLIAPASIQTDRRYPGRVHP